MQIKTQLSKGELLEKYAKGEPNKLIVVNGYKVTDGRNEIISDAAMDPISFSLGGIRKIDQSTKSLISFFKRVKAGITYELTSNCPDVRILIKPGSDIKAISTLLSEMTEFAEAHLDHFEFFAKEENSDKKRGITLFPWKPDKDQNKQG
jgi:hypothetical protein|tara:strand:- start:1257 stop:1703 length:447 start_codon:yes stop_codon:yes gene_type:complete